MTSVKHKIPQTRTLHDLSESELRMIFAGLLQLNISETMWTNKEASILRIRLVDALSEFPGGAYHHKVS